MTTAIHYASGDTEWPHLACGAQATSWQPQSVREPAAVTCARCKATRRYRQALHPLPLTITCPFCEAPAGEPCGVRGSVWRVVPSTHLRRTRLAAALAAGADAALDEYFPRLGQCGLCNVPGLDQRHRVIDAIAGALAAGEGPGELAEDYGVPQAAVLAVSGWMGRWPGAWT